MAKLALLGGERAVTLDYNSVGYQSMITEAGIARAVEMMRAEQVSFSPVVAEFEGRFARLIGTRYSLCTCNGTSAIQEALFACGVSPGDEVLAPSYTFWASCAPIIACGAKAVFCDVEPDSFNIDVRDMESRITPRTRAVILTHVWGVPCEMDAVMAVAQRHGIAVVEDAAHAHGAAYHGVKCGAIGDAGCFSLQGGKILVGGEGGVLTTNARAVYERALALGHYDKLAALPEDSLCRQYQLTGLGQKFRAHPLGIALANAGLDILEARSALRNANARRLEAGIGDVGCIAPQAMPKDSQRQYAYHFARYVPERLDGVTPYTFVKALAAEGMKVGLCGYGRLHQAPLFLQGVPYGSGEAMNRSEAVRLPVTERLVRESFMLAPRFETACDALIDQYIDAVHKVWQSRDALLAWQKDNPAGSIYEDVSSRSINML